MKEPLPEMAVRCSRPGIEGLGSERERTLPWGREGAVVLMSEMKNYSLIWQMTKLNLSVVAQGWLVKSCRFSKCGSHQGSSSSWASGMRWLGWLYTHPSNQLVKGHESTWIDSLLLRTQQAAKLSGYIGSPHSQFPWWGYKVGLDKCHTLRSESLWRSLSLGMPPSPIEYLIFPSGERHSL